MIEPFTEPLRGALHHAGDEERPCLVIAHGFKGFMGWGMFPWLADGLAAAGFAAVRFDFSHNGADANGDFTDLDKFRANTLTKEQEDLAALLDAIAGGAPPFGGRCRPDRIGLIGHSRGGGGVILRAARDPRVAAVLTLASVAKTDRFPADVRARAEQQGYVEFPNARTGQMMPVGVEAFRDAANHDILGAAAALEQPLLVVHGSADESVPVAEAHALRRAGGNNAALLEIVGAGHTFGAVHPFQGPTPHLEQVLAAATTFLAEYIG